MYTLEIINATFKVLTFESIQSALDFTEHLGNSYGIVKDTSGYPVALWTPLNGTRYL